VSRRTAAKTRGARDNRGRAFALRAKLRLHVIEATRLMLRNARAMRSAHKCNVRRVSSFRAHASRRPIAVHVRNSDAGK